MKQNSLLWVPKSTLSNEQLNVLREECLARPRVGKVFKGKDTSFRLYEETEEEIGLPIHYGIKKLKNIESSIKLEYQNYCKLNLPFTGKFGGENFEYQEEASQNLQNQALIGHGGALLQAPCASGKTQILLHAASKLDKPTVILVHKSFLMDQWKERILQCFDIKESDVGIIRENRCEYEGKKFSIAMGQSILARKDKYPKDMFNYFGTLLIDEVHRFSSICMSECLKKFNCQYRIGASATAYRYDGLEKSYIWHIGDEGYKLNKQRLEPAVYRYQLPTLCPDLHAKDGTPLIATMINLLCGVKGRDIKQNKGSTYRNRIIAAEIFKAAKAGRHILVLSDRIAHLELLKGMLESGGFKCGLAIGGTKQEDLDEILETSQIIFGTYQYLKEGIDVPELDTVFMATPKGNIEQIVGRILRVSPGKKQPFVLDFIDKIKFFESQAKYRYYWYTQNGYEVTTATV